MEVGILLACFSNVYNFRTIIYQDEIFCAIVSRIWRIEHNNTITSFCTKSSPMKNYELLLRPYIPQRIQGINSSTVS